MHRTRKDAEMRRKRLRHARLAASRQSADGDELRALPLKIVARKQNIGRGAAAGLLSRHRIEACAQQLDLGPDHRPRGKEQRHGGEADEIAGIAACFEIGVEHGIGVSTQAACAKIHQQEGEVVEHIDSGDGVVEFDGVEQHWRAVDLDDVAEMQIAVAVTHIASAGARLKQEGKRRERLAASTIDGGECIGGTGVLLAGKCRLVVLEHREQRRHACLRREEAIRPAMKVGDHLCKLRHDRERQAPLLRHAVVELRLVEPAHDECPLNGVALASKAKSTAFADNYRNHIEIKLTCGTSVDGKLVEERATPFLERRKVEKRVFDGALDLVGVGFRPEKPRRRGFRCGPRESRPTHRPPARP